METEDVIKLPACGNSEHERETNDPCASGSEAIKSDFLPVDAKVADGYNEAPATMSEDLEEDMDIAMTPDHPPALSAGFEMTDAVSVEEKVVSVSSVHAENGSLSIQNEISFRTLKEDESLLSERVVDASPLSGVKRPRLTVDEEQPSVHVIYSSLPRESKQKLEELLQQWSRWHTQKCSPSHDSNIVLESGEETYFPALRVGLDKPSEVTFWMDNQTKIQSSKEFIPLDGTSVPLYDRGYSLALTSAGGSSTLDGGVEKLDTSRCFNCSSYSHALKDCPKPRDSAAVNNARKEHKSKKNQHANSRNSTRYYQSSRGGKYEGLTPGVLDAETRQLLGLGELDPPPWLNRMRELGYPPGYLDADVEDQPSGIIIFGDEEERKQESEEGEILDGSETKTEPSRKMTVEFPGINAPIPENADETLWAPAPSSSANPSRDRSHRRYNQSSENHSRGHYSDQRWSRDLEENETPPSRGHYTEPRWSREFEDEAPPGCDPLTSPSLSNHYLRYGDYDSGYYSSHSPRASPASYGRSLSDRGRRSPLVHDSSPSHGQYGNFPHSSPR